MSIEAGLVSLLGGIADVYPVYLPEDTSGDAIVYRLLSETPGEANHGGASNIISHHYQFSAHSTTRARARGICNEVRDYLKDFSGDLGGVTIGFTQVTNFCDVGHFPDFDSWQFMVTAMFYEE